METNVTANLNGVRRGWPLQIKVSALVVTALAVLKEAEKIQELTFDGATYIDVPAPVITGAIVHVGLDAGAGNAMVLQAQKLLGAVTLAALILAAFVSLILVARFVAPLRTLTHAARRIVDGDLTQQIEVTANDEV